MKGERGRGRERGVRVFYEKNSKVKEVLVIERRKLPYVDVDASRT